MLPFLIFIGMQYRQLNEGITPEKEELLRKYFVGKEITKTIGGEVMTFKITSLKMNMFNVPIFSYILLTSQHRFLSVCERYVRDYIISKLKYFNIEYKEFGYSSFHFNVVEDSGWYKKHPLDESVFGSYDQDKEKATAIQNKLQGKEITINSDVKLEGVGINADRVYMLRNFKFRIDIVQGCNAAQKLDNNVYLVNKSDLQGGWQLIKWLFKGITILDGTIQIQKDGQPKNLLSINSKTSATPQFRKIMDNVLRKLIGDLATDEMGIPQEDLTIVIEGMKVEPNFLEKNHTVKPEVVAAIKKAFVGKEFYGDTRQYNTPRWMITRVKYRIADVVMINAENVRLECQYLDNNHVPENQPNPGLDLKRIEDKMKKYFNIRGVKTNVFSGEYRNKSINEGLFDLFNKPSKSDKEKVLQHLKKKCGRTFNVNHIKGKYGSFQGEFKVLEVEYLKKFDCYKLVIDYNINIHNDSLTFELTFNSDMSRELFKDALTLKPLPKIKVMIQISKKDKTGYIPSLIFWNR